MGFAALYPSYGPETNVDKIDFKKKLSTLYSAPQGRFATVEVPVMKFIKINGKGDPNRDPAYKRFPELRNEICQQDPVRKRLRRSAPRRPLVG
jgi:hypothetical protein